MSVNSGTAFKMAENEVSSSCSNSSRREAADTSARKDLLCIRVSSKEASWTARVES